MLNFWLIICLSLCVADTVDENDAEEETEAEIPSRKRPRPDTLDDTGETLPSLQVADVAYFELCR